MLVRSIGCDPGKSGAIVLVEFDGTLFSILARYRLKKPGTPLNTFCSSLKAMKPDTLICEKVSSRTGQGVRSVFTFGESNGEAKQALALTDLPITLVTPQHWQKQFGLVFPKALGYTKTQKKNLHKQHLSERYGFDLPHAEVDACLIAIYGAELCFSPTKTSSKSKKG